MNKEIINKIKEDLLKQKQKIEKELAVFTKVDPHDKDEHKADFPSYGDQPDENAQVSEDPDSV